MNKTSNNLQYLKIILFALMTVTIAFSNVYAQQELSPLKQFKSGVTLTDIKCNESFVLIVKESNGYPACVKPTSTTRLLSSGWITIEKFETTHPILQQNKTKTSIPKNIDITSLINTTNQSLHVSNSSNTIGSVKNQKLSLNYINCADLGEGGIARPISEDNATQISSSSVVPLPQLIVNPTVSSTMPNTIKILEIGMCPTQLRVGDKPLFTIAYQNISDKVIYHYNERGCCLWSQYTISPSDKVVQHVFPVGSRMGMPDSVSEIQPNQIVIDPAQGVVMLEQTSRNVPVAEYQIIKPGMLTVTIYLALSVHSAWDLADTIQFNVNATQ